MFTGIVTEVGELAALQRDAEGAHLRIVGARTAAALAAGASVSVAGVCLTATATESTAFSATASPETLRRTTLGALGPGALVNLETPLAAADLLGGHIVQGHVDGIGVVVSRRPEGVSAILGIEAPDSVRPHLVDRGSIAVDGVSLTISRLEAPGRFEVTLIPATLAATTLGATRPGDHVNLEADILSKYVARHLSSLALPTTGGAP